MNRLGAVITLIGVSWIAACSAPDPGAASGEAADLLVAGPGDFVVLPCLGTPEAAACAIVQAGGKTLVFGAPEGVTGALEAAGATEPDGLFLFTLEGHGLEGLMRLRNQTWLAGRTRPLPVAGPEGTTLALSYLDKALEQADAISYVRYRPAGRFDTALFAPAEIPSRNSLAVFDTGDLRVVARSGRGGTAVYSVEYGARSLIMLPCPLPPPEIATGDLVIGCSATGADTVPWPISAPGIAILADGTDSTLP